ncbi:MAG: hypothetical protein M3Z03_03105 [Actinomycetota bacterium]|jgi:hypothetical protein|nr:hypothetical protein [Actinomycetota bacterium]
MSGQLPAAFADLEPFIEWAIPTEEERYQKRLASTIEELRAFFDAIGPRAAEAREYLDKQYGRDMSIEDQRLLWMMFSLICISYAVEVFGVPAVPDSGSAYIVRSGEPQSFPV